MVKIPRGKKTIKTYGKKNGNIRKNKSSRSTYNLIILNEYHHTHNYNFFIQQPHSSSSSSSSPKSEDTFDRLLKDQDYNTQGSTSRFRNEKVFLQRQDTVSFYQSHVHSEPSSHGKLFVDTSSSDLHSMSHLPTPPSYQLINKKLVKHVKIKEVRPSKVKYKRLNRSIHVRRSITATSSTPTRPQLVTKGDWIESNISPILPVEMTTSFSQNSRLLMIEEKKGFKSFDISALAEGLGKLGIGSSSMKAIAMTTRANENLSESNDGEVIGTDQYHSIEKEDCQSDFNAAENHVVESGVMESNDNHSEEEKDTVRKETDPKTNEIIVAKYCNTPRRVKKHEKSEIKDRSTVVNSDNLLERCEVTSRGNESCMASDKGHNLSKHNRLEEDCDVESSGFVRSKAPLSPAKQKKCDLPIKDYDCDGLIKDKNQFLENEGDLNMVKPRLSLRPGKRWKRSLLQQRLEESRKSSCCINRRRSTIGPALLAKLVKAGSQNMSLPNITQEDPVNETFNETLPILRLSTLNTITRRRGRKVFKPLDIVQEEEPSEPTFSLEQSYRGAEVTVDQRRSVDVSAEGKANKSTLSWEHSYRGAEVRCSRRSLDFFDDDEDSFNENEVFCSGVNRLPSADMDQSSCMPKAERRLSFVNDNTEEYPKENLRLGALARCGQDYPLPFEEVFPDNILHNCKKIGEGVFGEVFMLERSTREVSVLKIIPVEGTQRVNNEPQKCFDEVLSEIIISEELSLLRSGPLYCTSGFCELKNKFCLQGSYPSKLIDLWKKFAEEDESENDCPDMFGDDQLYIALELDHAGQPVESYKFETAQQAFSVFLQTTFSLGAAEQSLEFEHRDLHIGNVLIKDTTESYVSFIHDKISFELPTYGVKATIIDFTLSRISFEEDVLYCDLEKDPEMFTAEGDYQFEIYRLMRQDLKSNWRNFAPITNTRWLDYLADKLITKKKYKRSKSIVHKQFMKKLSKLKEVIVDFESSFDLSQYLLESYKETIEIIKMDSI